MKIAAGQIKATLKNPDPKFMAWLTYGPDEGKIREYALQLAQSVLQGDKDPLRQADFLGKDIKAEPAKFFDEAGAISMFGGRRVIRIRQGKDEITDILKDFLEQPIGDAFIIVEAGDLKPSSKLRKLFESQKNAAAIPCYLDEARDIAQMADEIMHQYGISIEANAKKELLSRLGSDHSLSRGEIEKLCLYKGEGQIKLEDVEFALGDSAQTSLHAVIMAAASGQIEPLEIEIRRLWHENISPITLLRVTNSHFLQLQQMASFVQQGMSPQQAVEQFKPPIFFKVKPAFIQQVFLWNIPRIKRALDILAKAEEQCKFSANLAPALAYDALIRLAAAARRQSKTRRVG